MTAEAKVLKHLNEGGGCEGIPQVYYEGNESKLIFITRGKQYDSDGTFGSHPSYLALNVWWYFQFENKPFANVSDSMIF